MASVLSVSEAARLLGARPKDITTLLYTRQLREDLCPIVCGRRQIPEDYLPLVRAALKRTGKPVGLAPEEIAGGAACAVQEGLST